MNEKVAFAQRLKNAMAAAGLEPRPAVLEKQFNSRYWGRSVTFQAVSRWLNGHSIPSQEKLQVIAELLGVEPHALRYGEEAAQKAKDRKEQWERAINYEERETFEAYLNLSPAKRKVAREVILALAKP